MIAPLTLRLIAVPEHAWPRLTAACDSDEPLPSPLGHALVVALIAVVFTVLGSLVRPGSAGMDVLVHGLAALAGYGGAAAVGVFLLPALVPAPEATAHLRARFVSAAMMPLLASGVLNLVPLLGLNMLFTLAGAGLTGWSAWLGASGLLGAEGPPRQTAAIAVVAGGALPILAAHAYRLLVLG